MARPKRKDKTRTVLRTGELQRSNGSYQYSWTDENHKRRYVYSKTLEALRIKEEAIEKDKSDGIKAEARYVTLDDLYELWKDLKRGLKNNTFENYKYIYETFVRRQIGSKRVSTFLKSDIKRFYNYLVDERGLKPATVDGVHNILHQIFDMAVDDNYIRNNPTNNVLRELKKAHCFKTEKRRGLTRPEQELFMDYLKNSNTAVYWYPVFAVMLGTGLRVGEAIGIRWDDIDLENRIIDINHSLTYYQRADDSYKCEFRVSLPKTEAGNRRIPMMQQVYDVLQEEYERQKQEGFCVENVDGMTNFVFTNRFGMPHNPATVNRAIKRIVDTHNSEEEVAAKKEKREPVMIPRFSCHIFRHTFASRFCENETNIKVIQEVMV
ncbi:tyrosine-type recombinase/integrase [Dorea formicigenerans]|uniref:Transposase from transposon Tn916 n=1 Tax=Dorea formicigenerans TaxID=39486 RepID=A0A564SF56_9FIRM|nr:tyrosine-type recombinase/integrase [Dorea formicigenerans]VUW93816.1 Transposase from transposon Tn916 [Dorea formicigenerans]